MTEDNKNKMNNEEGLEESKTDYIINITTGTCDDILFLTDSSFDCQCLLCVFFLKLFSIVIVGYFCLICFVSSYSFKVPRLSLFLSIADDCFTRNQPMYILLSMIASRLAVVIYGHRTNGV